MYLCNLQLTGKGLPDKISERIMNEVSSMVDIISFGVPDTALTRETPTNVPNFEVTAPSTQSLPPQPPPTQPPQSNIQTLSTLAAPLTGYGSLGTLSVQGTGYPGRASPQGFTPQPTGPQPPAINLGLQQQYTGVPQVGGLSPGVPVLQSQPTGRPGQWGFVNAPAGSLAGIEALQQQLMPQPGREGGFSSIGLQGNANVPWAVTKDEKT
jgi:actin cytoskeleton-regulatory complex protein PAN1